MRRHLLLNLRKTLHTLPLTHVCSRFVPPGWVGAGPPPPHMAIAPPMAGPPMAPSLYGPIPVNMLPPPNMKGRRSGQPVHVQPVYGRAPRQRY